MGRLVLTRTDRNKRIFVGDDIIVELVDAELGKARIAITAPDDITVLREEVLTRGKMEKRGAIMAHRKRRQENHQ